MCGHTQWWSTKPHWNSTNTRSKDIKTTIHKQLHPDMISHSFPPVTSNLAQVVAPTRRPTPTTSIMSKCEHDNYQENTMLFFVSLSYKRNYHNSHNLLIAIRSLSDRSSTWKKRRQHSPTLQQESAIPLHFAISNLKFYSRNHENFPYCPVCRRSIFWSRRPSTFADPAEESEVCCPVSLAASKPTPANNPMRHIARG
jgi:hypothetical protein